jgi:putative transposase
MRSVGRGVGRFDTPSLGELSLDEGRGLSTSAILREGIYEVKFSNTRTNVVGLLLNGFQERKFRRLANICARLWNELNYERRKQFFSGVGVDFRVTEEKYYERYKGLLGSANTQAVIRKNNEAWNSFFTLLKMKKEGKLPPHMVRVSPPGYWKDREEGRRKLLLVIRQDRYIVDEVGRKIVFKDFRMEVEFVGRLRWYGRQGRLEIYYDPSIDKWYACIPVEVGVETAKTGRVSKFIVRGERRVIQVFSPRGSKSAFIDLGVNILATVVVSDGVWVMYRGVRVKEDYFYIMRRISETQSLADRAKNLGEFEAYLELKKEVRRLYGRLRRRLTHLYRNLANHLIRKLWEFGVSTIYLGYPYNIAQDSGNKFSVNLWHYRKLVDSIEFKAQEYGVKVYEVIEYNTSKYCVIHDVEVKRITRGVVECPLRHKLHADLNGALNIMKKATGLIPPKIKKPQSYIVDHNKVAPVKGV